VEDLVRYLDGLYSQLTANSVPGNKPSLCLVRGGIRLHIKEWGANACS